VTENKEYSLFQIWKKPYYSVSVTENGRKFQVCTPTKSADSTKLDAELHKLY
jgi:hypothetical protein